MNPASFTFFYTPASMLIKEHSVYVPDVEAWRTWAGPFNGKVSGSKTGSLLWHKAPDPHPCLIHSALELCPLQQLRFLLVDWGCISTFWAVTEHSRKNAFCKASSISRWKFLLCANLCAEHCTACIVSLNFHSNPVSQAPLPHFIDEETKTWS